MNADRRSTIRMMGLLVLGMGIVTVGIAVDNMGLLGAGIAFVALAVVTRLRAKRKPKTSADEPPPPTL